MQFDILCVDTIAVDLQTVDGIASWRSSLRALDHLRALLSRPIRLLANGVYHIELISQLRQVWPDVTISNLGAYFVSDFLRYKDRFGLDRPWGSDPDAWTQADIFSEAVRQYTNVEAGPNTRGLVWSVNTTRGRAPKPLNASSIKILPTEHRSLPLTYVQLSLWAETESIA